MAGPNDSKVCGYMLLAIYYVYYYYPDKIKKKVKKCLNRIA